MEQRPIAIHRIGVGDVWQSLRGGVDDFLVQPTHYVFLCIVYPVMGLVIGVWTSGGDALPLLFPLVAGFALLGPMAAVGLYEISRRREEGIVPKLSDAFTVFRSPALGSVIWIGLLLLALFVGWLFAAQALYGELFPAARHGSIVDLARDVLTTPAGWTLLLLGHAIGFLFAVAALAVSLVSLPLVLDRNVGALTAIRTSIRACWLNKAPVLFWGFLVAAALILGSAPLFVGLAVVLPILGHGTWRLYRHLCGTATP
ncbi:MAG: DUF2189 domain-containing protein [Rhizobiaceae bacterium]|nr:DUF2189 domain-containing protein [Rhizobiaceae bacterium]